MSEQATKARMVRVWFGKAEFRNVSAEAMYAVYRFGAWENIAVSDWQVGDLVVRVEDSNGITELSPVTRLEYQQ